MVIELDLKFPCEKKVRTSGPIWSFVRGKRQKKVRRLAPQNKSSFDAEYIWEIDNNPLISIECKCMFS